MLTFDPDLKILSSSLINDDHYLSGFGTKSLGDARHIENVFNFFNQSAISYKKIVIPEQIHSVNVEIFKSETEESLERIKETDGIITQEKDAVLMVITGDCLPIVYADKKNEVIGISHQGWRGSLKKMVQRMVEKMVKAGSKKEDILIALGPSIGDCCYDIDDDRYYSFLEEFDGYSDKIFYLRGGKRHLNLPLLNYLLLIEAGVPKKNIDFFPFCTRCDKERFFSFRRDTKKDYGEMMSFVMKHE